MVKPAVIGGFGMSSGHSVPAADQPYQRTIHNKSNLSLGLRLEGSAIQETYKYDECVRTRLGYLVAFVCLFIM